MLYSVLLLWISWNTTYLYDIRHLYDMYLNVGFAIGISYFWIVESGLFLVRDYFSPVTQETVPRSKLWYISQAAAEQRTSMAA